MVKKISKILLYVILGIVVSIGLLAAFSQTGMFRAGLRSSLYKIANQNLNGSIYIGEINGNIFTGFSIDTLFIFIDNAPFLQAGKVSAKYDPLPLLRGNLSIVSLKIENPVINIFRNKNGEWNINRLLHPQEIPEDSSRFQSKIAVKQFVLSNAVLSFVDSTENYAEKYFDGNGNRTLNYSNVYLEHFTMELSGFYREDRQEVAIKELSFSSPRENFTLTKLAASLSLDSSGVTVKQLLMVTPVSTIDVSAEMKNFSLFHLPSLEQMQHLPLNVQVRPSVVNFRDLQFFLPVLYFLHGSVSLTAQMDGEFGALQIKNIDGEFGTSSIHLAGMISNLHKPHELYLDITSTGSDIEPSEVSVLLPFFSIPKFTDLGRSQINFHYAGMPLNFSTKGTLQSPSGNFSYDVALDITNPSLRYTANVSGEHVKLHNILSQPSLASNLNVRMTAEGEGVSVDELNAAAHLEIDSSEFNGIPITNSKITLTAKEKIIAGKIQLSSPEGKIHADTKFDCTQEKENRYHILARCENLNAAPLIADPYFASTLNFTVDWNGTSFTTLEQEFSSHILFHPSVFAGRAFDSADVSLSYSAENLKQHELIVKSPVTDISVSGTFSISDLLAGITTQLNNAKQLYYSQRRATDSSFVFGEDSLSAGSPSAGTLRNVHANYSIELKNLFPLSVLLNQSPFDMKGTITGTIIDDSTTVSFLSKGKISSAFYADSLLPVGMTATNMLLRFSNDPHHLNSFDHLQANLLLDGTEVIAGKTSFHLPHIQFDIAQRIGSLSMYSDIDSNLSIGIEGTIAVMTDRDSINFSKINLRYQGYDLLLEKPAVVQISSKGIETDSILFSHRDELVMISGLYSFSDEIAGTVRFSHFDPSDVYFFLPPGELKENMLSFSGEYEGSVELSGSSTAPLIQASLKGTKLRYKEKALGNLSGIFSYAEKKLTLHTSLMQNDSSAADLLRISGVLPIDLRFTDTEEKITLPGMDINFFTQQFPIEIFDAFIPELADFKGTLSTSLHITGTLRDPFFDGRAELREGSFLLEKTGITYTAEGTIQLQENAITFPDFHLQNISSDFSTGNLKLGGSILMKGFVPNEFHVTASGEVLVLKESSRLANAGFFGNVIAATDNAGILFEGTFEQSKMSGTIFIRQANMTFPPTQQASTFSVGKFSSVVLVDDTSKQKIDTAAILPQILALQQTLQNKEKGNGKTFLDGLTYEFVIQTQGSVRINMIFNANAGAYEELYAELNGKLILTKDAKNVQLKGSINVGSESNYTFYKKFNASGSLVFVGVADNPQLNIIAKYQGQHCKKAELGSDCSEYENVVVTLTISGTRTQPKVKIGLATLDQDGKEIPRTGDIDNDAISFLLTSSPGIAGKFRDELTSQDRDKITQQITQSIGGTYLGSMLSGYVMDFIQKNKIPFVKQFEVRQVGLDPDVRIGAEFLDAYVNIGGKVFTDMNNANISVQIPLGDARRRNFMLEVEKKTDNPEFTTQTRTTLGARIFYRFTF